MAAAREDSEWVLLSPCIGETESARWILRDHVEEISKMSADSEGEALERVLRASLNRAEQTESPQALQAALWVLTDLVRQSWSLRVTHGGSIEAKRPEEKWLGAGLQKARIRTQELIKRDEQLKKPTVRKFVLGMERTVFHRNSHVSIFSLFRNGKDLSESLKEARESPPKLRTNALRRVIDPYLQFTEASAVCEQTGLRLHDIWRYFRHTWTNQYTSTPGRSMAFLVRDRAAKCHPVMGIGAISSPIVQIRERDEWIGWDAKTFFESILEKQPSELRDWIGTTVKSAIDEIFIRDFLEDMILDQRHLRAPTVEIIADLRSHGERQRALHNRFVHQREHKAALGNADGTWRTRAATHLYRSKRAISLAQMLRARIALREFLETPPTRDTVRRLIEDREGRLAVKTVLRKAKADRVGIAMADITVCGAVEPYNQLLGGKLVSMIATSPEVVMAYRDRYAESESAIASSVAGRAIVRPSHLVYLGTTSLYSVGSSQYNRLKMPTSVLGGNPDEYIQYHRLGKSEGYGTSHFSAGTYAALVTLVEQTTNGQRVNSIFGEGVSPKLRKLRDGLTTLGLPDDVLLQHGRRRIVYGVPLVRNLREYLLGLDKEPDYLFNLENPKRSTRAIVAWWLQRWLSKRIMSDEILARLNKHVLVRPIQHGARVMLPRVEARQQSLFDYIDS